MKRILIFLFALCSFSMAINVGDEFPDFSLTELSGGTFTLSDYRGKVVYIFWFGNGCPSCKYTNGHKTQTEIVNNYTSDQLEPIGIDTWTNSTTSTVGSFKTDAQIYYDLCLNGKDLAAQNGVTYDLSMVIDQKGIVRYIDTTPLYTEHDWPAINSVIQGLLAITDVKDETPSPYTFELKNNYPNPFNPLTSIPFSVNKTQNIKLEIYDVTGKVIRTIVNTAFEAGQYEIAWDSRDNKGNTVSSGIYFYRLQGETQTKIRRMMLVK